MSVDWLSLGWWTLISVLGGLVIFHAVAGYYHLRYYVRRRDDPDEWKCQPTRELPPRLQREAVKLSTFNLILAGLFTGPLLYGVSEGLIWSPVYYSVSDYGWIYTAVSTVLLFVIEDALAYYVHRALHTKPLYKRFHRSHHRFVATTPYVTIAIHPVAFLALQLTSFIPLFILPLHAASIGLVFVYILVFNIVDHSGVSLDSSMPWQASSRYHDDHHVHFHVNFGQHLQIWDRLHGTLRRKGAKYGKKNFGGKGVEAGTEPSDFVRY